MSLSGSPLVFIIATDDSCLGYVPSNHSCGTWRSLRAMHRTLLSLVVVLGLVAGIAFSASYQLVARFANKNTISLGLGCVGSGIVTLIVETALRMGSTPSHKQELILFEATAGMLRGLTMPLQLPRDIHFQTQPQIFVIIGPLS